MLAIIAATFVTLLVAQAEAATPSTRGFLCEKGVWTGPSKDNSLVTCLFNPNHLTTYLLTPERLIPVIVGGLCIVTAVLIIFVYPLFMICRYCCNCCGGRSRRPDATCCGDSEWDDKTEEEVNAAYDRGSVKFTKGCAFVVAAFAVAAVIITVIGSGLVISAYDLTFFNAREILTWAEDKRSFMYETMLVPDKNDVIVLVPGMQNETFQDMRSKIQGYNGDLQSLEDTYAPYVQYANIGAICVATVPMVFIVITVLCAIFNMRTFLLALNSVFHWIFIIIYGLVGGLLLILSVIFVDIEGERQKMLNREPGLFMWSLVPQFDDQAPFKSMETEVSSAQVTNSREACVKIQDIATSQFTSWRPATPNLVYNWNVSAPLVQCTSIDTVNWGINSMSMFSNSPTVCSNLSVAVQRSGCSLAICAKECSTPQVKDSANEAVANLRFAAASFNAFGILLPLLQFSVIFYEMLDRLSILGTLADAMVLAGVGLCLFCVIFTIDMFVIFRGQKRFFSLAEEEGDVEPPKDAAAAPPPHHEVEFTGAAIGIPIEGAAQQPAQDGNPLAVYSSDAAGGQEMHQQHHDDTKHETEGESAYPADNAGAAAASGENPLQPTKEV